MARLKQKIVAQKLAENATLDKPLTAGEIVASSGYGPSMRKNPQVILESQGVKEELAILGFTVANAKSVVSEIMLNPDADDGHRLKAASEIFKVEGSYAPIETKGVQLNIEARLTDDESEKLRLEYEDRLKGKLLD